MTKDFLEWICYHLDIIVINFVWVLDVRLVYHAVVFLILWRLWYFIIFMCAGSFISGWVSDESSTFKHVSRWFYIMDNCESYVICKTIVELKHWHVPCGIIYNLSLRLLIHGSHIKLEPWKLAEMVHLCRVEPVLVFSLRLCPIRGDARFYFYVWEMFEWI